MDNSNLIYYNSRIFVGKANQISFQLVMPVATHVRVVAQQTAMVTAPQASLMALESVQRAMSAVTHVRTAPRNVVETVLMASITMEGHVKVSNSFFIPCILSGGFVACSGVG